MSNFREGQKVLCVFDDSVPPAGHVVLSRFIVPQKGRIYTVRRNVIGKVGGQPCILVEEIPDQIVDVLINGVLRTGDVIFSASCFRPIVDRKTDISIFKAMLTPKNEQVPA